ncbi:DUF3987 domain-containing protein [Rhizobium sp. NLR4a]|uniref:DUF3987 domain-containing protein n=1 Tax=Rhizobium sp. NLR4a TaxID=2731117 RepID=UPI001C832C30|nr:DNA-primase RepB domain-containing protein [Rhizobium sp. NLR4a]MBX5234108.1 DUF3987 domain-containing protein [Rhizobium sp. NLR4a]
MAPIPKIETRSTPAFDEAFIRRHVEMIHGLAQGLDGVLVTSAYYANPHGDSDAPGTVTHHAVGDVDGMVDAIMAHASTPNANVFTGLQVMRKGMARGKRGSEADIVAILGLVVDLDADTGNSGDMPIEPNAVLETSPGNFQPFVLFDRPLSVGEAKPLAAALKRATGSDHGTADVTHVWRIPGCLNWPNRKKLERGRPAEPALVDVNLPWDGSVTIVEDLRAALGPWMNAPYSHQSVTLGELPSVEGLPLSDRAAEMLAADDVGDRSAWASKVVEQLAFEGLTAEQACAAFRSATGNWFERYASKDPIADFRRMWSKFGKPHEEERAHGAAAVAAIVASHSSKEPPAAANDNAPPAMSLPAPPKGPEPPPMHADPFEPSSAGGLLAEIARWITSTAIIPVPELSLSSALALIGGMFGDRALGPTRSGLNLFLTTVMGVASGKGHAPKSIVALAASAGRPGAVTNGDPTSYAAIERMLRKNSSTVVVMDEFGVTLQDINAKRTNAASASIRKFLLAIYDQADSVFHGRQYASDETKKDDSPIDGPALTVLGMTTPTTLYAGLSDASLNDGFLSRFVFIEGQGPSQIKPPSLNRKSVMPSPLVASLKAAQSDFPAPKGFGAKKLMIPFDGGEDGAAYRLWTEVFLWQHDPAWDERQHHINGRAAENTVRLASIRAVSRDPRNPVVTEEDVAWGWAIVYRSIQIVSEGVERHMSGSTVEALRKAIVRALEAAPANTLAWSHVLQREGVSCHEGDDVSKALQWLIDTGKVESLKPQAKPGARGSFKLVALSQVPPQLVKEPAPNL